MTDRGASVEAHYARGDLGEIILAALAEAGLDAEALTPADLAPMDEFHIRGREATAELARLAGLSPGMHVLDVGSGVGGPSRHLADEFGCRVTGLDLTQEFCRVAAMLSARAGLGARVDYRHGDALAMPFAAASFDAVWTQHASMNIADKARLYGEMLRVLRPGGRLALYDIAAGPGGEVHFPVPWAREPSISFLTAAADMRAGLEAAGFRVVTWRDDTEAALAWFRARLAAARNGPPPLSLDLLLGADWPAMATNQVRNLEEGRIALVQAVLERPA